MRIEDAEQAGGGLCDHRNVLGGIGREDFPEAVGIPSKQEFRRDGKSLGGIADVGGVQATLATQ